MKGCLETLGLNFSDKGVVVDLASHNPTRIWKVYGTLAAKGDNTKERPHRLARILEIPRNVEVVNPSLLNRLARTVPETPKNGHRKTGFDLTSWIAEHKLPVVGESDWRGGRKFILNPCPWNPEHKNRSAYIVQFANGAIAAGCLHTSCDDLGWRTLRDLYEPTTTIDSCAPAQRSGDNLPPIIISNRPIRDISEDSLHVLDEANVPPTLFVRSSKLAEIIGDECGRHKIEFVGADRLRGLMDRVADYMKITERGEERHCAPRIPSVRDILTLDSGTLPFPPLQTIVEVPILRPDGSVLTTPGYDRETKVHYAPSSGLNVPGIITKPGLEDVTHALSIVDDGIGEFPYVEASDRANALGLLLTLIVRIAISGRVPLALLDAPQAGTGKSLLVKVMALIATGRDAAMTSAPREEEEWRKSITATLSSGASLIIYDNLYYVLQSPSLAMALTAEYWKDRILGESRTITLAQKATWVATGNNIRLGGDLPRRCYRIRLDAKVSRPWQRTNFRHKDLQSWVEQHRDQLLWALLTLARAWYAAGKPKADVPRIGGFEEWAETVGGILAHAGVLGFLGNVEQLYELADDATAEWQGFLGRLLEAYGQQTFTVAELTVRLKCEATLTESLPGELLEAWDDGSGNLGSFRRKLGKAFASRADTRYGNNGLRLERAGTESKGGCAIWRVAAGLQVLQVSQARPSAEDQSLFALGDSSPEAHSGERTETNLQNLANPQSGLCRACGSRTWWFRTGGGLVCQTCHPKP